MEEGEVDVDPGDEAKEVGEGLDGAELGAAAAGADDGDFYRGFHAVSPLRGWQVICGCGWGRWRRSIFLPCDVSLAPHWIGVVGIVAGWVLGRRREKERAVTAAGCC